MLNLIVLSLIAPIVVFTLALVHTTDTKTVIAGGSLLATLILIRGLQTYLFMPSRNILSILAVNLLFGIAMLILMLFIQEDFGHANIISVGLLVILLSVVGYGEAKSIFAVKSVANSIKTETVDSDKAPTFKKGVTPVALSPKTVRNRMNKNMSDVPNSQYYKLGEIEAQYYRGKPVYIAPVEFDGFFKYYTAKKTVPGYFIIDATSVNAEPKFVKATMSYTNSSYFGRNAWRKIYQNYPTWLAANGSDPQLEVDDHGTPYYVQTAYKPVSLTHRINYSKLHVIAINATNGRLKLYDLKHLPNWIDEGITADVAESMNRAYGSYQGGWLNMHFGKTGVQLPTNSNVISTFDKQGNVQYFTDFTNPRSDADSALGYSMINARTGKLVYYKTHGIMDSDGATNNANNNYKAQQWEASMPVIYNINGRPTWVLSILDDTNAFRGYYYLDAADQSVHATGNSANDTIDAFRQALVANGTSAGNTSKVVKKTMTGIVDRAVVTTKGNEQVLLLTLQNSAVIYTINGNDYPTALLTRPGDHISMRAQVVSDKALGNSDHFLNQNLK